MKSNQKYGGPPYRRRVYYSMAIVFALMVVMAFKTGQPAWVLAGVVGPAVLIACIPPRRYLSRSALMPVVPKSAHSRGRGN
jgi:uncharacterized protein (DUF983 family)